MQAALLQTAQIAMEMPEQYEALEYPQIRLRADDEVAPGYEDYVNEDGEVDTAALPFEDPWYCDPSEMSKFYMEECPQPCDPEADSDCEVPCRCPLDEDGSEPEFCELCPDPDVENDTLPVWLRLVAQIFGAIFEFHVIFLAILPWWILGIVLILVDIIYDYLWYIIFFAFCKPCAYVFIWIFNIPMLLFHLPFWW